MYRCNRCSTVFSDLSEADIDGLYDKGYFEKEFGPYFAALFGDADDTPLREHFGRYLDVLEQHVAPSVILDVGCAAGLFLDVARNRRWRVMGVEISEHAASVAKERRGIEVRVGDVMDIDLPEHGYDAVTMLDVLEHLPDPGELLQRVRPLIRPGGVLMLSLPNDHNLTTMIAMLVHRVSFGLVSYPASRVHQIYHVTYFTPNTITRLLREHGFEVLAIHPDETVRGLLNEGPLIKIAVSSVFAIARLFDLQNKMLVVAAPR